MSQSNVELDVFASVGEFFDLFFPPCNFQFWVLQILKIMTPSSMFFFLKFQSNCWFQVFENFQRTSSFRVAS
jgi:hypothetical protein